MCNSSNKYKYAIIDNSYILARNHYGVSAGKKAGEYTVGDLIQSCIYTLNKIPRDFGITADKYVFLCDKWSPDFGGYYTTHLLGGAYKDNRGDIESKKGKASPSDSYMTQEKYDELKNDPEVSKEDLEKAYEQLYSNEVRRGAKYEIIRCLSYFGVPSFFVPGWEFDNLAYLASKLLYDIDSKPSVIITKDSDLLYSLSPKMDYFKIPTSKGKPEIRTYSDVIDEEFPEQFRDQINLYEYKAYCDSLGFGHNGMRSTRKKGLGKNSIISNILDGDMSDINDVELFKRQFDSFDILKYPGLDEARDIIENKLPTYGDILGYPEWSRFCTKFGMHRINNPGFYSTFVGRFNKKLLKGVC